MKRGASTAVLTVEIDISDSTTVSDAFDTKYFQLAGLIFPAMTGSTITFQASDTLTGTYVAVNDDANAAYSITKGTSAIAIGMGDVLAAMAPFRYLRLVSGSAEAADRSIKVILKE